MQQISELQMALRAGHRSQQRAASVKSRAPEVSRVVRSLREMGATLGLCDPPDEKEDTES